MSQNSSTKCSDKVGDEDTQNGHDENCCRYFGGVDSGERL